MLMAHVAFIACEIFLYNTVISLIFSDLFYAWLAYYAYMTMSNTAIYAYMAVMFLAAVLGVFQLLTVGGWFLIYIGQLACYGYAGYELYLIMKTYSAAKEKKKIRDAAKDIEQQP